MNNIYNYIEQYGNNDLIDINELDALIFTRLSYVHIEDLREKLPFRIEDLNNYIDKIKISSKDKKLVNLLSKTKRFKDIIINRCKYVFNEKKVIQFFAITIILPDNSLFISFRGTDRSLTGLMEDLELSYGEIPSQILAKSYIDEEPRLKKLYLGGHSKGGNLAQYAFLKSSILMKKRINRVYNFDGPGLLDERKSVFDYKIMNYYPNCSVIGRMLDSVGEKKVIKSLKKGIEGHNIYNWEIANDKFKNSSFTSLSDNFFIANTNLLKSIKIERRKIIINYFCQLLEKRKIQLTEFKFSEFRELINSMPEITEFEKDELIKYIKVLIKSLMPEISHKD